MEKPSRLSGFRGYAFDVFALAVTYVVGVFLRIIPVEKYGVNLLTGDPLIHYWTTRYLIEHGHLPTYNPLGWHPWSYNPMNVLPDMHYYISALLYRIVSSVSHVTLYQFVVYIPAFFAPLLAIPLYLLVKELWGRWPAFVTIFSVVTSWAYVMRTEAGFFRHEQLAIPLMVTSFYFTVKAMRSSELWKALVFSGISGVFLALAAGSWAGFRQLFVGYPLVLAIFLALKKADLRDILALGIPPLYVLLLSFSLPNLAFRKEYMAMESTFVWAVLAASLIYAVLNYRSSERTDIRIPTMIAFIAVISLFFVLGIYRPLTARLMRVVFPGVSLPKGNVVETVAEHAPGSTITTFSYLLIPILLGLSMLAIERWREKVPILILVNAITSLYFAESIARLPPLAAPLSGLGVGYLVFRLQEYTETKITKVRRYSRLLSTRKVTSRPTRKVLSTLKWPILLIVLLLVMPISLSVYNTYNYSQDFVLGFDQGWRETLGWLKNNTSPGTVVLSWWDYGYWIQLGSDRVTLADGLTINSTQIRQIAKAFSGSEEELLDVMMRYNASYVVVDIPAEVDNLGIGGKWQAIFWIAKRFKYDPWRDGRDWLRYDAMRYFTVQGGRVYPTYTLLNTSLYKIALSPFKNLGLPLTYFKTVFVGKTSGYNEVVVVGIRR